jgi:hypothetical protein
MWSGLHLKPPPSAEGGSGIGSGSSAAMTAGDFRNSTGQLSAAGLPLTASDTADGAAGGSGVISSTADGQDAGQGRDAGAHEAFGSFTGAEKGPDLDDDADRSFAQLMGQMTVKLFAPIPEREAGGSEGSPHICKTRLAFAWRPFCLWRLTDWYGTGVRERLKDLPDSQRRAGAEQMALQMMQLLGIDDSDDGTEDSTDAAE